ncbi:MAG: DUF3482 domain-containing protein [Casimicrobiaceae bacterium]
MSPAAAVSPAAAATVALSLISHTNAGKTTLARTLLDRDVGEVRDAAHVTVEATRYTMIETPAGDRLELWDTPGFGDSTRLAARLAQQGNPIGWFLGQVWDRFRDRPLWLSQQAVRNVRDEADVVLYLVNASEQPGEAGYIAAEFAILRWIGKPVLVLLNQTGEPRDRDLEAAEARAWSDALAPHGLQATVLTLDAFARCWVQEIALLRTVAAALPEAKHDVGHRLAAAWQGRRWDQFHAAIAVLAGSVARAAVDRVAADESRETTLRSLGRRLGIGRADSDATRARAIETLAARVEEEIRASTDELIAVHGLAGQAANEVLDRVASHVTSTAPVDEGKAAVFGGVVSGMATGLAADLAAGGLTLGAGVIAGGVLGALGAAGLARGYNVVRGTTGTLVHWSDGFLLELVAGALLRYLAVAHYGRGRGSWQATEYPVAWVGLVAETVELRRDDFTRAWDGRLDAGHEALVPRLDEALTDAAVALLQRLYPDAMTTP